MKQSHFKRESFLNPLRNVDSSEGDNPKSNVTSTLIEERKVSIMSGCTIRHPCNIMIIGMSGSGKTNLGLQMIRQNAMQWNRIYCLSDTGGYDCLPPQFCLPPTNESVQQIIDYHKVNQSVKGLIIFDDLIGTMDFTNNKMLDGLASRCRHFNLSSFFIFQDVKKVSASIRQNCSVCFVIPPINEWNFECVYGLTTSFRQKKDFKDLIDHIMKNYRFRVIRLNRTADAIFSSSPYQTFPSALIPKFKLNYV